MSRLSLSANDGLVTLSPAAVPPASKLTTMEEAVSRWIPDGASIVMGAALEALIPFAAGHEIIRQQRHDLTLIGPISDVLFDQLIGAGCVSTIRAAWVGNVSAGLGHNYRRAAEHGVPNPVVTEDHSNFSIALALLAGALGAPYIPTHTLLGTDILRSNPSFRVEPSPFGGEQVVLVPAIKPDVAILHVQRSDEAGNCHAWGNMGVSREALLASRSAILVAEEIVTREVIVSDPNRVLAPAGNVVAVVHAPGGAHPSPVPGHYNRDHQFFASYHSATRDQAGWQDWHSDWIVNLPNRQAYLEKLGAARWESLLPRQHRFAAPVSYGY